MEYGDIGVTRSSPTNKIMGGKNIHMVGVYIMV